MTTPLVHLFPMPFLYPLNMFSGGRERVHWEKCVKWNFLGGKRKVLFVEIEQFRGLKMGISKTFISLYPQTDG